MFFVVTLTASLVFTGDGCSKYLMVKRGRADLSLDVFRIFYYQLVS